MNTRKFMMHPVLLPRVVGSPRPAACSLLGCRSRALFGGLFALCLGVPLSVRAQTFTAPSAIQIPRNTVTQGPASLYPSPLTVSGAGSTLTGLSVTFLDLSHAYPDDIDVLLVGPGGQNVLLMSDAGGFSPITSLTLTFSDTAASFLADNTVLSSGTFKPTNYDAMGMVDSFASPAPNEGPYGSALSVFNGTNPNGAWNLYVLDDTQGNAGSMAGGWSLTVTAVPEPSSFVLGVAALAALGGLAGRRRRVGSRG